jgi:aspartate dehydrogenase
MPVTRVAIGGLGAIGRAVARKLADGMPGARLRRRARSGKARASLDAERITCPLVEPELFQPYDSRSNALRCSARTPAGRCWRRKTVMVLRRGAAAAARAGRAAKRRAVIIVPTGLLG